MKKKNKKKTKNKNKNKNKKQQQLPSNIIPFELPEEKRDIKPVIIGLSFVVAVAALITYIMLKPPTTQKEISRILWSADSAQDASGDEVEMDEIYKSYYSTYNGSITFSENGTFNFWLGPGNPDDGKHTGKYTVKDSSTLSAVFDNGEQTEFKINRTDGEVTSITADYNGYKVNFVNKLS